MKKFKEKLQYSDPQCVFCLSIVKQGVTVVNHNYYQGGVVVAGNAQIREGAFNNVGVIAGNINEVQDGAISSSSKIIASKK